MPFSFYTASDHLTWLCFSLIYIYLYHAFKRKSKEGSGNSQCSYCNEVAQEDFQQDTAVNSLQMQECSFELDNTDDSIEAMNRNGLDSVMDILIDISNCIKVTE